jgi:hypothetical protein
MRLVTTLVLGTTLSAPLLSAQTTADRWSLQFAVTRDAFQGASADTTTIPGATVEVAPAPRLAFEAGASRGLGAWEVGVSGGYSAGALRAKTDALLVDDRSGDVTRFRASLSLGRRLATFGAVPLLILAGPALDHWKTSGVGDRTTFSARVGLALRIPLGPVRLENLVSFGIGESPFRRADLPAEAQVRTLRTWSFGLGLRIPLRASPHAT